MMTNEFMELIATSAKEYCEQPDVNEVEIDRFIEFLYRKHCKLELLLLRGLV